MLNRGIRNSLLPSPPPVTTGASKSDKTASGCLPERNSDHTAAVYQKSSSNDIGFQPSEPAQINFSSLRSLSSQSLSRLAEEVEINETTARDAAANCDDLGQWKVKNTFIDFESASAPLRNVLSAAARLDTLGEDHSQQQLQLQQLHQQMQQLRTTSGSPSPSPWTGSQFLTSERHPNGHHNRPSSGSALDLVHEHTVHNYGKQDIRVTENEASAGDVHGMPGLYADASSGTALEAAAPSCVEAPESQKRSQDTPMQAGDITPSFWMPQALGNRITVKNTFLDFGPEEPVIRGLRAVHTASGRLDLMGQDLMGQE